MHNIEHTYIIVTVHFLCQLKTLELYKGDKILKINYVLA